MAEKLWVRMKSRFCYSSVRSSLYCRLDCRPVVPKGCAWYTSMSKEWWKWAAKRGWDGTLAAPVLHGRTGAWLGWLHMAGWGSGCTSPTWKDQSLVHCEHHWVHGPDPAHGLVSEVCCQLSFGKKACPSYEKFGKHCFRHLLFIN